MVNAQSPRSVTGEAFALTTDSVTDVRTVAESVAPETIDIAGRGR